MRKNFDMKKNIAIFFLSALVTVAGDASKSRTLTTASTSVMTSPERVITKMMEKDQIRQLAMSSYSVMCRYSLQNKSRKAEMLVRWTRTSDGVKRYEIVSESGDGGVRSHVFHKLLDGEVEASQPSQRDRSRFNTSNYSFRLVGEEMLGDRNAYVFELEPKNDSKYLTRGRIWVDASDYAIIQVAGAPAHNVSFWTKKVDFVQSYQKQGNLWLMASNHSLTDAKLFGLADLTIEYFDYQLSNQYAKAGN
jgi:hypothetical protein